LDLGAREASSASTDECVDVVETSQSLINQLNGVLAAHVAELAARGYAARQGYPSLRTWLREHLRISDHAAYLLVALAEQLQTRPAVAEAVSSGALGVEQASVIGEAVDALRPDVSADVVDACEARLIEEASHFPPRALRLLGERVLAHVAPEIADDVLRRQLETAEARAHAARSLTLVPAGPSRVRIAGTMDAESAAIIRAALDPLSRPVPGPDGARDPRLAPQRRVDALVDICAHSMGGGDRPFAQVAVTVSLDALTGRLGAGVVDTGDQVSPGAVRRLACSAGILPVVLGSESEVLDLGRQQRLFAGATRRALILRDRGCAFPGCDRPPSWCDGHHLVHWGDGGETNVDNGVLLCRHHHRVVHEAGWVVQMGEDKRPEFVPPPSIDPLRVPQRNHYRPLRT
jgi:hypothetical protein